MTIETGSHYYTMQYFATPASNRDSSIEFLMRGLHYRKLQKMSLWPYTVPVVPGRYHFNAMKHLMGPAIDAVTSKYPVPVSAFKKWDMSKCQALPLVPMKVALATTTPLSQEEKIRIAAESRPSVPKAPNVYVTRAYLPEELKDVLRSVLVGGRKNNNFTDGRSGAVPVNGVASINMMAKILWACLSFQTEPSDDGLGGGPFTIHEGVTVTISDDAMAQPFYIGGGDENMEIFSLGSNYARAYKLEADQVTDIIVANDPEIFEFRAETLPAVTSHIFGYFPASLPNDHEPMVDFVRDHFFQSLDNDSLKAESMLENLSTGLKTAVGSSNFGVLLHVTTMLTLAHKLGARVNLIYDGNTYLGAQVVTSYPIFFEGKSVVPVEADSIRSAVADLITLTAAQEEIATLLSDQPFRAGNGKKVKIVGSDIDTWAKLCNHIGARVEIRAAAIGSKAITAIPILAASMGDGIVQATSENIEKALTNISENVVSSGGLFCKEMLTHPSIVESSNLAVFGSRSISFMNIGGKQKDLFQDITDDPSASKKVKIQKINKGQKAKGGMPKIEAVEVPYWNDIRVSRVPMDIAVADFLAMKELKAILQIQASDGKMLGNIDVHAGPGAAAILSQLRKFGWEGKKPAKSAAFVAMAIPGLDAGKDAEDDDGIEL